MEQKHLNAPIKDFDSGGYDDVEFIPKSKIEPKSPEKEKNSSSSLDDVVSSSIDMGNTDIPMVDGFKLQQYFLQRFKETHGYEYKSIDSHDINVFEEFKSLYGNDAGPMIRILFDKHQGKIDVAGGVITVSAFKKGSKWIQDLLYCDLQEDRKRTQVENSIEGMTTASDFIKFFSMAG